MDDKFKRSLERDVVQCFIHGLRPELEIRILEEPTFREVIIDTIDMETKLAICLALRKQK